MEVLLMSADRWGEQLDMFASTPTPARPTDPETSSEAAESVDVFRARQLHIIQLRMLASLAHRPDDRTHEALWFAYCEMRDDDMLLPKVSVSGFRTRLSELKNAGLVRDSGTRAPMSTGRNAVVWAITLDGLDLIGGR